MDNHYSGPALFALSAVYVGILLIWLLVAVGIYLLVGFSFMSLFKKVGVEPWAAWVPVYNNWKLLEVSGQAGWYSLFVFVPYVGGIATAVFMAIGMYRIGRAFGKDGAFVVLGIFLPYVWAFILGSRNEVYRPEAFAQSGWPAPLAGYGSAVGPVA